jgi:hypothetical protein
MSNGSPTALRELTHYKKNGFRRWLALSLAVFAAAAATQPVFGQTPLITFTEYSSTSLTVTYTDSFNHMTPFTVENGGSPDNWVTTYPGSFYWYDGRVGWKNPEGSLVNYVYSGTNGNLVQAGQTRTSGGGDIILGAGVLSRTPVAMVDGVAAYAVYYNRNAQSVPETGSAVMLMSIGVAGLGWLRRKFAT